MKLFFGCAVSAGLLFAAATANAQLLAPYEIGSGSVAKVSDFDGPYAAMPPAPDVPPPRYGYGPGLLPPQEVYMVLRENGFSPLGIPRQRGLVYTISVIDRSGDDGRLVIDARTGRIIRFIPAYRMGDDFEPDLSGSYHPAGPMPPPIHVMTYVRGVPRPPAPVPHVASRSVPVPKPNPLANKSAPAPAASQQATVAPPAKPAEAPQTTVQAPQAAPASTKSAAAPQAPAQASAPTVGQASPPPAAAPAILPTQDMPQAQGLE
jgi:hypothetical protein